MLLIPESQPLSHVAAKTHAAQGHSSLSTILSGTKQPKYKSVQPGQITRCRLQSNRDQVYYLYLPRIIRDPGSLFVSVHGISRNAKEHARHFADYAEQQGVVMLVPRFDRSQGYGRNYQRLSDDEFGTTAADVLNEIIQETDVRLATESQRLYLFGFSGGGQFVHRYLAVYPQRVVRAAIGAAGWYTFPDPGVRFPRGLKPNTRYSHTPSFPEYLSVPVLVVVGERDQERDPALNRSSRIDRQQGENRVERGQRWIVAMQSAARDAGLNTRYRYKLLPGTGHDFSEAMSVGRAGDTVWDFLFS